MALSEKQKAFCEYYASCFNATESAIKAGYSKKTAYSIGNENLKKPEIKSYLEQLTKNAQKSRIATIEEVFEYLTETMRDNTLSVKDRTKSAQLLMDALNMSSGGSENGEVKIVIERKVVDLSKDKK